jgi:hypothetical protein
MQIGNRVRYYRAHTTAASLRREIAADRSGGLILDDRPGVLKVDEDTSMLG